MPIEPNRPLTEDELRLARWMLQHGESEAVEYIKQLDQVRVTPFRCPCGCATIELSTDGKPPPRGVDILGEFVFDTPEGPAGVFIYASGGVLAGIEVYGLAGDAPTQLPTPEQLRPAEWADPSPPPP